MNAAAVDVDALIEAGRAVLRDGYNTATLAPVAGASAGGDAFPFEVVMCERDTYALHEIPDGLTVTRILAPFEGLDEVQHFDAFLPGMREALEAGHTVVLGWAVVDLISCEACERAPWDEAACDGTDWHDVGHVYGFRVVGGDA